MKYIDIAEAKKQLDNISNFVNEPMLLIGGLAINQYDVTRRSQDIDLVCCYKTASEIVRQLYPLSEWIVEDENNDEYRPAYKIQHKFNENYPIIKIGPKIEERETYKFLNWENLKNNSFKFKYRKRELSNILIPSIEGLCYTKIISFLGRNIEKIDKLTQDLDDVIRLSNIDSFQLGSFLNYIHKNNAENEILEKFCMRLNITSIDFNNSNFSKLVQLFSTNKVIDKTCNKSIATLKQSYEVVESNQGIKLAAFDLDGTLIKGIRHSWTKLWDYFGADRDEQIKRKEDFKRNKLSYIEWCKKDCEELMKFGLNKSHFPDIVSRFTLSMTKNFHEGIGMLKSNGIKTALISGGIDTLLYTLLPDADNLFDEIFINKFIYSNDGKLVNISPTEYDWDSTKIGVVGKNRGLERICEKYNISINDAAFIGDDLNDIEAMNVAGHKFFYCGASREFKERLPPGIIILQDNNFVKVVEWILNPPTGEQV